MRKLLHEAEDIDRYLFHKITQAGELVFQARMIISADLREKVALQRKAHQLIRWFSRDEKRSKLELIYKELLKDENFKKEITSIFR